MKHNLKKFSAFLLSAALMCSFFPTHVYAEEESEPDTESIIEEAELQQEITEETDEQQSEDPGDQEILADPAGMSDAITLTLNNQVTASIASGELTWFKYTPSTTGIYVFDSYGTDSVIGIYNSYGNAYSPRHYDTRSDGCPRITVKLYSGTLYYFTAGYKTSSSGTFGVKLHQDGAYLSAEYSEVYVKYGQYKTLKVKAEGNTSKATYQWYCYETDPNTHEVSDQIISGATSNTYTVYNVLEPGRYRCDVFDGYYHSESIMFNVYIDNELYAYADSSSSLSVSLNGSTTLKVIASAADMSGLTYQWAQAVYVSNLFYPFQYFPISGETSPSLTLSNLTQSGEYVCFVKDRFNNQVRVDFDVRIENGFTAKAEYEDIYVFKNESATLRAIVSAKDTSNISYTWFQYRAADDYMSPAISGQTSSSMKVSNITEDMTFVCRVKDKYGSIQNFAFWIMIIDDNEVRFVAHSVNVAVGSSLTLNTKCKQSVTYESLDPEYAKVDQNGKVTGLKVGYAVIKATTADNSSYDYCYVNILFKDVMDEKLYYYWPVYWAAGEGITNGYSDGTFGPKKNCTREAVVTFLWRMAGKPEPANLNSPFSDVQDTSKYYYKAVLWAAEQGITKGYDDGTFKPNATCLREHVVTFLWRYAGKPWTYATNTFTDVSTNDYYYMPVLWAAESGITKGYADDNYKTFRPKNDCLREHVVTFLYRYDN